MFIENNRKEEGTTPEESNFSIHNFFYKHVMPLASVPQPNFGFCVFPFDAAHVEGAPA
jgi:hypothetical protein